MNKLIFIFSAIILWSCTGQEMEIKEARITAEKAINLIGNKNFDELATLYSEDFSNSEPKEERINKFTQIADATGATESFELTDSLSESNMGEESRITLTYKVKHAKLTMLEKYKIGKENGKYVIAGIDIQMSN